MRILPLLLLALATTGCENLVTIEGTITVADGVGAAPGARVLLLINDDYRYPMADTDGMWGAKAGGVYVVDAFTGADLAAPVRTTTPAAGTYPFVHEELAYYPSKLWLGAFIDENGNGVLDPGEPVGQAAANPITDIPVRPLDDDRVTVDVVIDHR